MDPKLTILFCLIGTIIGLSHFGGEQPNKLKRQSDRTSVYPRKDNDRAAVEATQVASRPKIAPIKADRGQTNRG
jgi:hypothetical protein